MNLVRREFVNTFDVTVIERRHAHKSDTISWIAQQSLITYLYTH